MYLGADLTDDSTFKFLKDRIEEDKHQQGIHAKSSAINESRPLFAVNCYTALCVLGNRPSTA